MRRNRNGKIIATIGPSTGSPENLGKLYLKGVDVFRLNFSHGSHEDHAKIFEIIRSIGRKHHIFPTILADLQGPKLRIGTFRDDKITLKEGDVFRFDADSTPGNLSRVYFPHPEILGEIQAGTILLLDDGKLKFEVVSREENCIETRVLIGGQLSNKKGINIPNLKLPISNLTKKDLADLEFALELGADWIVLSFVQSVEDVEKAKNIINGRAGVISKLEKPQAIKALEPIINASDAIMIARGDLGVEVGQENVPSIQKRAIGACQRLGRPVIVATQMLESMIVSPTPTRAEVSDVANAVYQGVDAIMLSAESAVGQYPFEAVEMMDKIIEKTESDPLRVKYVEDEIRLPHRTTLDAICMAAKNAAEYSCASAIVLFSNSFEAVSRCSRMRPRVPIVFVSDSFGLASKCGLCGGVYSVIAKKEFEIEHMYKTAKTIAMYHKFAAKGDNIVVLNNISGNSVAICEL
ncbi:MAG: pyruvate kinase [Holosporaceae bacterium]|jgi:pyruvate kinase|nr:pyruvate kinase [Holosporaceae bacterium]